MEKLNELFSRACELSELGKKCNVDLNELTAIRDEFWVLKRRAEAAEAKLAELERQECLAVVQESEKGFYVDFQRDVVAGMKLFTRPAPAVSLAELVPDEATDSQFDGLSISKAKGWNACRDAILRNIEEAK